MKDIIYNNKEFKFVEALVNSEVLSLNGMKCAYVNNESGPLHMYVWSQYNGEVPKGYIVNVIDKDMTNMDLSNLELVEWKPQRLSINDVPGIDKPTMTDKLLWAVVLIISIPYAIISDIFNPLSIPKDDKSHYNTRKRGDETHEDQ